MKQILLLFIELLRWTTCSVFVVALLPVFSFAQSQSASIGVRATVEEPLGVTGIDAKQGHFLLAPTLSTAFVLFEGHGVRLATTLRADKLGIIEFGFSETPFPESYLLKSEKTQKQASLLTVILTEN